MEFIAGVNEEPVTLPAATKLPKLDHVPEGQIVLIRFIRSDLRLDVFTDKFRVPKALMYSYVKAVIDTSLQTLSLYLGEDLITSFEYAFPSGHGLQTVHG